MDEVWLRRAVDQFASVLISAVQGRFDAMLASRRPRAAELKLSSDSELHYSGVSRRGLFSKAIRLGLYTCILTSYYKRMEIEDGNQMLSIFKF